VGAGQPPSTSPPDTDGIETDGAPSLLRGDQTGVGRRWVRAKSGDIGALTAIRNTTYTCIIRTSSADYARD